LTTAERRELVVKLDDLLPGQQAWSPGLLVRGNTMSSSTWMRMGADMKRRDVAQWPMAFHEIERVINALLPGRAAPQWWTNEGPDSRHMQCNAWREAEFAAFLAGREQVVLRRCVTSPANPANDQHRHNKDCPRDVPERRDLTGAPVAPGAAGHGS